LPSSGILVRGAVETREHDQYCSSAAYDTIQAADDAREARWWAMDILGYSQPCTKEPRVMRKRYRALRIISTIYRIIAILLFIVTVLAAIGSGVVLYTSGAPTIQLDAATSIYVLEMKPASVGTIMALVVGILLTGSLTALAIYAFSNLLDLLVATEENTRYAAMALQHLASQPRDGQPKPKPSGQPQL
jgi:hypothetical protein